MGPVNGPTDETSIGHDKLYHNTAIGLSILCPLIALLPPRRVNLGTAGLGASWLLATNYLVQERRNKLTVIKPDTDDRIGMSAGTEPTSGASAVVAANISTSAPGSVDAHMRNLNKEREQARSSRAKEYEDKLDEGASYADIIKEQIWNVWNQDKGQKD